MVIFFCFFCSPPAPEPNSLSGGKDVDAQSETKPDAEDGPANELQVLLPPVFFRVPQNVEAGEEASEGTEDMVDHAHPDVISVVPSHCRRAKAHTGKNHKSRQLQDPQHFPSESERSLLWVDFHQDRLVLLPVEYDGGEGGSDEGEDAPTTPDQGAAVKDEEKHRARHNL